MNSEEDISRAAESLVSTLKRLHEELLGFDALLQERGRSLYDVMPLAACRTRGSIFVGQSILLQIVR